jgi:hypothetical protein
MQVPVDLNDFYDEKSAFYRKLDDLCMSIRDLKAQQEYQYEHKYNRHSRRKSNEEGDSEKSQS